MKTQMIKAAIYSLSLMLITGCSGKSELYKETDKFVESLNTTYESYGVLGTSEHSTTTSDGLYNVRPIGRLINVKILKVVEDEEYEDLKEDLKSHYKGDKRVNDVYICQGGTVMIDCRN